MKFYWITNINESPITGKNYYQIEHISADYGASNTIGNLTDSNALVRLTTEFQLAKGSKLTDVLCYGPDYFIFNAKTKAVFEQYAIRDTYFIPVKVIEPSNDKWFVMYTPFSKESVELIDYHHTLFHVTDPFNEQTFSTFHIDPTIEDKIKVWREHARQTDFEQYVQFKELYLKDRYLNSVDLFYLSPYHLPKNLVSERLKEALEAASITGFKFIPASVGK